MSDNSLSQEVVGKVLLADVSNILKKAKSGKPLTKYERTVIEKAGAEAEAAVEIEDKHAAPHQRTGGKFKPLRWTIAQASSEFDKHRDTLTKSLKRLGILPGDDNKFSTLEIVRACFGDDYIEKVEGLRKDNELKDIEIATLKREMLPTEEVLRVWGDVVVAIRQVVKGSNLSDTEKHECLRQIRELKVTDFGKEKEQ